MSNRDLASPGSLKAYLRQNKIYLFEESGRREEEEETFARLHG